MARIKRISVGSRRPVRLFQRDWKHCQDCPLGKRATMHVFHRGSDNPEILFIGEAPGPDEDQCGLPFVGRAGRLLNILIEDVSKELQIEFDVPAHVAVDWSYAMMNTLACVPWEDPVLQTGFRQPKKEELQACAPRFVEQLTCYQPKLVVLLGKVAEKSYKMLERPYDAPTVAIKHPSALLRAGGVGSSDYDVALGDLAEAVHNSLFKGRKYCG